MYLLEMGHPGRIELESFLSADYHAPITYLINFKFPFGIFHQECARQ